MKLVPKSDKMMTLYVDEEPIRDLHVSIFGKKPVIKSLEHLAELEYQGARRWVLKRLSVQATLSTTLREQLREKKVTKSVIDRVIQECEQAGYLNDQAWVESFIRVQKRKRVGPKSIQMKLLQKGISVSVEVDEEEQIRALLESKYSKRDLSDYKERQKVVSSLHRKGYSISAVLKVMGEEESPQSTQEFSREIERDDDCY